MYTFSELEGERVKLVPLEIDHTIPLFNCLRDPEIWGHFPFQIHTIEEMRAFIQKAIAGREQREQYPYAVWDKKHQEYVGTTRFLKISEQNNNLKIGTTLYSPKVWRTRVNTETKYLMLKHVFETLDIIRVEIIASINNVRSQQAIERLGATKEGILRKKYNNLDYVIYSIIQPDWIDVKNRLEGYLNRVAYA